jgi:solute carrier family 25 (mitochondrial citrate transporter), member 1
MPPSNSTHLSSSAGTTPTQPDVKVYTVSPAVKAVAGSLGGIVEACALQPVDVVKTRLQLDKTGHYKGMVSCGRTIAAEEGVRSLWKGLTPFIGQLTLKYALRMGSNAFFLELLRDQQGQLSTGARLTAGLGAGVSEALLIVTPFEVVKTRLQQQRGNDKALLKYRVSALFICSAGARRLIARRIAQSLIHGK